MKTTSLKAKKREELGKRYTKVMRRQGIVPAVVYGEGSADHIAVNTRDLKTSVFTSDTYIVNLDIEGEKVDTIIREIQFHPVKDSIEHIDFMKVSNDKPVILTLPVNMVGTPKGVTVGGRLITKLRKIKVRGVPSQLPSTINIDVSDLELGGTIKIKDANITGIDIVTPESTAVASVEIPRSLRSASAAAQKEA